MIRQRAKVRVLAALLSFLLAASCLPGVWGVNGLALGNSGRGSAYTLGDSGERNSLLKAEGASLGMSEVEITHFEAPSTFRTYTMQPSGAAIEQLAVTMDIAVRSDAIKDTEIVIPLDYEAGHLGASYFAYDRSTKGQEGDDVIGTIQEKDGELVIGLNSDVSANSVQSITLFFDFEKSYDAMVPPGTVLWRNLRAFVRTGGTEGGEKTVGSIQSDSKARMRLWHQEMLPGEGKAEIGNVTTARLRLFYDYAYQTDLNYPVEEIWYFPKGTEITSSAYFHKIGIAEDGRTYVSRTTNSFADWRYKYYAANYSVGGTFHQDSVSFILPDDGTIASGEKIQIIGEARYQFQGQEEQQLVTYNITYTTFKADDWDLYLQPMHRSASSTTLYSVSDIDPSRTYNVSKHPTYMGYVEYGNSVSTRNQGAGIISGVHLKLEQVNDETVSPKVNYNSIFLRRNLPAGSSDIITQYRYYFTIADANGGERTTEEKFITNTDTRSSLTLPSLEKGEYIQTVHVIPYGQDATNDNLVGQLLPRNSLSLEYYIKTWSDMKWPDGTPMDKTTRTLVPTQWTLDYLDAQGVPEIFYGDVYDHIYAWHPVYPYAKLANVDSNANNLVPGGTVNYEVQGYNDDYYARSGWVDPVITIKVPAELTISDDFMTTVRNASGVSQSNVDWEQFPDTADGCHVYRFTATNYTAPISSSTGTIVFTIPVTFQIAPGTASGTHTIPGIMVSSAGANEDFIMGHEDTVTLHDGFDPAEYGYEDGDTFACVTKVKNDSFTILEAMELSSGTQIQTTLTGGWSEQLVVPVGAGGTAGIKLQVTNMGNLPMGSVALYDIMPYAGYLGNDIPYGMNAGELMASLSNVEITVDGKAVSGGSLYLNTGAAIRNQDIGQVASINLNDGSWIKYSSTIPATVTALYFDYGNKVLQPGETLEIILTFAIPDRDENMEYTVYNIFGYCGSRVESGIADPAKRISFISPQHGFTSELYTIQYKANGTNVTGLPDTDFFHNFKDPGVVVTTSPQIPQRDKYTFTEWNTQMDGRGKRYDVGQTLTVTSPGILTLYAQWDRVPALPVEVSIRKADAEDMTIVLPGADFRLYKTDEVPEQDYGMKTTLDDGIAKWGNLSAGTYRLEEENAPEGYRCLTDSVRFTLQDHDGMLVLTGTDVPVDGDDAYQLIISNEKEELPPIIPEPKTAEVSIRKVDSEDSARLLPGAVFRLYKTGESPEQDYGSKTTDDDGIAGWENLPAGTYRLEEEDAPEGYECLAGSIRFTLWNDDGVLVIAGADAPVDGSDPYRLCIANEKEQQPPVIPEARTTDITIRKVDGGDSAIRLSGAVFRLYKVSGGQEQDLGAVTTQRDGAAQWIKLEAGNYRLEEQTPPDGYLPLKDSVYFELVEAGENFSVKVTGNAASKEEERTLLIPNEKIQVTTEGANLTAVKSSNPVSGSAVNTGETITYTVAVTNTGDEPAEKVVVTDVVPQYTSYVADSATNSGVHNSDTNTVTWELGTLEPGKTVKVGFQVKVQSIANNTERTIRNVAQYRHDGEAPATTNATLHYQKRKDSGSDGGKDPGTDKPDEHDRTPGTDGGGNNSGRDRSKDFGGNIDIHDEDIPLATTLLTLLDEDTPLSNLDIPDTGLWRYFWMIQLIPSLCLTVVGLFFLTGARKKEG